MLTNCLAACAHLTITVSEMQRDICEKIVILSYPLHSTPPLGGFPLEYRHHLWVEKLERCRYPMVKKFWRYVYSFWRDPRTWRTDRRTDGQTLHDSKDRACIASRGKNRGFHVPQPTFIVSPGDAPAIITQYVAWLERQFNACQTPLSMYISIFNSFRVIRCLSQCVSPKIAFLPHFCFPGDAAGAITLNVVWWKGNSMLTNCLAECTHL